MQAAAEMLGEAACAIELPRESELLLRPHMRLEGRRGILGGDAILKIDVEHRWDRLRAGLECYRVESTPPARIVRVLLPYEDYDAEPFF